MLWLRADSAYMRGGWMVAGKGVRCMQCLCWGFVLGRRGRLSRRSSIQVDEISCIRDHPRSLLLHTCPHTPTQGDLRAQEHGTQEPAPRSELPPHGHVRRNPAGENDQRPRSRLPRPRTAPSPRRARPPSAAEPNLPTSLAIPQVPVTMLSA